MSKSLTKTVVTSMIGNMFEWYDYALFGYFAPIIGKLFFPSGDPVIETISAFSVFAIGFLVRPLGGMIFGHIGDRLGRKRALVLTILFMAIPTAAIGVLPSYNHIGIAAPIFLVILRMFQGVAMGGNYGGSITFTTEHADPKRRGLFGSFAATSCLLGIMLGSAAAAFFAFIFPENVLHDWGWRIPFLLGIFICLVGYYMRRQIPESPEYIAAEQSGELIESPVLTVFSKHKKVLSKVVLAVMLHDLSFYVLFVYMATYFSTILKLSESEALTINTLNLIMVSACTIGSGWLSDKVGRKPVLAVSAALFVVSAIPLLMIINASPDFTTVLCVQMILAVIVGGYFGPISALMVEAYPTAIRFSAVSITTNISGPLFGGTAPMLMAWLGKATGSNLVPAYYLTAGAVIALISLRFIKAYVHESVVMHKPEQAPKEKVLKVS